MLYLSQIQLIKNDSILGIPLKTMSTQLDFFVF